MSERQVVWKFPFKLDAVIELSMPAGAKLLSVAPSNVSLSPGELCLWAAVYPNQGRVTRRLSVYGTGHPLRPETHDNRFVGTVHLGAYVWHVFDEGEFRQ